MWSSTFVDEVGYLTYGTDAANMLFHVVNDRHRKKRAMIFTTNKPLSAWGRVLHDEDLAHAIVDRILERGRVLTLDGPSMRTKHLGLDDPTASEALHQPASTPDREMIRISGIEVPEFPEPTTRIRFVERYSGSPPHDLGNRELQLDEVPWVVRDARCRLDRQRAFQIGDQLVQWITPEGHGVLVLRETAAFLKQT